MLTAKEKQLLAQLEPLASEHNVEIVTVEVIGSKKSPLVRVYIDTEKGVSFQELTESQEWIGALMDRLDPFPGAYTLEVSSPGIDRPLRTPEHFKRFCGEEVSVRTVEPVAGSMNFKGLLKDGEHDSIVVERNGEDFEIALDNIKRANVVGKIEF